MKKTTLAIFFILAGCTLFLSGIWIYFQKTLDEVEVVEGEGAASYNHHYLLISDDTSSLMWEELYRSASQAARESDAYLELVSTENYPEYSLADYLRIGIASQVDGIILKPDESEEVRELLQEAVQEGIPVITVLEDDSGSGRTSFVGLNSYQLANAYAEQIVRLLKETGRTDVAFLSTSNFGLSEENIAYYQMKKKLDEEKSAQQEVEFTEYQVDDAAEFNTEEFIRDLFVSGMELPDILICMDETVTECVYQALVDYNEVGNVKVIGFYYSDTILEAIRKQILSCSIVLDMQETGENCIYALEEYYSLGHTSDYYSVGQYVITAENVSEYLKEDGTEASDMDTGTDSVSSEETLQETDSGSTSDAEGVQESVTEGEVSG